MKTSSELALLSVVATLGLGYVRCSSNILALDPVERNYIKSLSRGEISKSTINELNYRFDEESPCTLLMLAVHNGWRDLANRLLSMPGVDPNVVDEHGDHRDDLDQICIPIQSNLLWREKD